MEAEMVEREEPRKQLALALVSPAEGRGRISLWVPSYTSALYTSLFISVQNHIFYFTQRVPHRFPACQHPILGEHPPEGWG